MGTAGSLPGELFPLLLLLLLPFPVPLPLLPAPLLLLLPLLLLFPFILGLLPVAVGTTEVDEGLALASDGDCGAVPVAAASAFFWCFFMQNVEQKLGFGAFARITLSHWMQAPLLYALRNSRMHVSEQNSFLPFCVGSTYLSGVLASPHQMQVAVLLVADVPLLPADVDVELLLPTVSLRGVRPPEPPPPPPDELRRCCSWLLATSPLLLLVMLLLLLLPGDELPAADITNPRKQHTESRPAFYLYNSSTCPYPGHLRTSRRSKSRTRPPFARGSTASFKLFHPRESIS